MQKELYELHARLKVFIRKVEKSKEIISEAMRKIANPYIACSFGKDSSVLFHLITQEMKYRIPVVCVLNDIDYPDNHDILEEFVQAYDFKLIVVSPQVSAWECVKKYNILTEEINIIDELCFFQPLRECVEKYSFDGFFMGLRKEESRARFLNLITRGKLYRKKDGMWVCCPLADWTTRDVFAYLISRDMPISAIYDKTHLHPNPECVREGWAIPGGSVLAWRGGYVWLQYWYPEIALKLRELYPRIGGFT